MRNVFSTFLDQMEKYFNQPTEVKMKDTRPQWGFQVGATPSFTEKPRDHSKAIEQMDGENKPTVPKGKDAKWRFFWRAGERPTETKFESLNMPPVIPEGFPDWEKVMNRWASLLLGAVSSVAEMLALGLGVDKTTFTSKMKYAPHLLAPTGSDLGTHCELGTVLAGWHYDLNFLTIHGKSRYPGLSIWLRNGKKVPVKVPDGCLLLQAGKQLEWLTGGHLTAGFHEVVVTEDTLKAVEKAREEHRILWRISSTLFSHIASDQVLKPIKSEWENEKYPPTFTGEFVANELKAINLMDQ